MYANDTNSALRNLAALVDFSNLINSSLDLNFTLNNLLLTIFGKLHTTKGFIALANENRQLKIRANKGFSKSITERFPDVNISGIDNNKNFFDFLKEADAPVYQKILSTEDTLGVIVLGKRMSNQEYKKEDLDFLHTLLNIGATAIENSIVVDKLRRVNRDLDAKVNQLSSLFDLSKEFSGILEVSTVGKLLVYTIIGQLLVSKFAVITCQGNQTKILETKIPEEKLTKLLKDCDISKIDRPISGKEIKNEYEEYRKIGIELIVPMQIQGETKGAILLGKRKTGGNFSQSDIEYISSVGSLAMISIENARLFEQALEKERMEKDLEIAQNIQRNLLPSKRPALNNFEISAVSIPARQVGGDYYDVVKLDEKRILFAIADVSGKGVQAALMMANLQAFLKSISKQDLPLDKATNLLNDLVSENTSMGNFVTFFWGIANEETKELTYVNAGHNPPLLLRNGSLDYLKEGGLLLGLMETMVPYKSEEVQLENGDCIILFTDGVTEAMNPSNEEYSEERLENLAKHEYSLSSEEILNSIQDSVKKYTKDAVQSDDFTTLVVKVK